MADNADNGSTSVVACAIVCQVVSGLFVAARFYCRGVITRTLGWDDYCILIAWIVAFGYTVPAVITGLIAVGRHMATVDPDDVKLYFKLSYVYTIFYQLSLAFCKISILLLYIRILAYTYARRAAFAVLAIVIIYNIFGFISSTARCRPLEASWDFAVKGQCNPPSHMWALISLHIATDLLIFLLPIPVVYRMTMPLGQKIGVLLIFALGFFVCLVSILRAVWIQELYDAVDVTWEYVAISNWTAVEVNVSILVPCLIVLKPLLSKLLPSLSTPNEPDSSHDSPPTIGSDPMDLERAAVNRNTQSSEKGPGCHCDGGNIQARRGDFGYSQI